MRIYVCHCDRSAIVIASTNIRLVFIKQVGVQGRVIPTPGETILAYVIHFDDIRVYFLFLPLGREKTERIGPCAGR